MILFWGTNDLSEEVNRCYIKLFQVRRLKILKKKLMHFLKMVGESRVVFAAHRVIITKRW